MMDDQKLPANTAITKPPDASSLKGSSEVRPHECQYCKASFKRVDHLKRHLKLHTGKMRYQCPCGDAFSRNDVLARHIRLCATAQNNLEMLPKSSARQSRSKTACNQCAKLKLKCDSQQPCRHCKRKSVLCKYTRQGYEDPYYLYRIERSKSSASQESNHYRSYIESDRSICDNSNTEAPSTTQSDNLGLITKVGEGLSQEQGMQQQFNAEIDLDSSILDILQANGNTQNQLDSNNTESMMYMPMDLDLTSMFDFGFDPLLFYPETVGYTDFDYLAATEPPGTSDEDSQAILQERLSNFNPIGGLSLLQIDPVEAKCHEIRELLKSSEPLVTEDTIRTYVTRYNLLFCIELYAKNFQPNVPILHIPTFRLIEASPVLLLAIMLVGACYSDNLIPVSYINKLAMRLFVLIESQSHEINMEAPPISTIQASIILRPILVCSRNATAVKFASIHFARNISMAERAGVFEPVEPIDHSVLTESSFKWNSWIEQETRRRVACQIFAQGMALCVFNRKLPSFSPLSFNVELPCYESCWEAETATQCLDQLQTLPVQLRVSTAIQYMLPDSTKDARLFEASSFGMTILILGLHGLLFQATQNSLEPSSNIAITSFVPADPTLLLDQELDGNFITNLADELVSQQGSSTLKCINTMLNTWRVNWDLRSSHDLKQENRTFSGDPLKFWWLAKLYLVLHFYRHVISKESEFAIDGGNGDQQTMTQIQLRIASWLLRFRRRKDEVPLSTECYLSQLIKPLEPGY